MCPVAHSSALDLKLLTQCWTLSLLPSPSSFHFFILLLKMYFKPDKKIKPSKIQNLAKCLTLSGYSRVAKCILSGCSKVCKQKFFILKTLRTFFFLPHTPYSIFNYLLLNPLNKTNISLIRNLSRGNFSKIKILSKLSQDLKY